MRFLRRLVPWLFITTALATVLFAPELSPERYTDLASLFSNELRRSGNHGYAVAVVKDGVVIYRDAFGTDGTGKRLSIDTPMYLGPTSEVLTGALLQTLIQRKELSLDDDLRIHLPWKESGFGIAGAATADATDLSQDPRPALTLRSVAAHEVELDRSLFKEFAPASLGLEAGDLDFGPDRFPELFRNQGHGASGPTRSRLAYRILGRAMEGATGQHFDMLLSERVLIPLGMHGTTANPDSLREIAVGSGPFFGIAFPYANRIPRVAAPADGIISTAADMGRFLSYLVAPPRNGGIGGLPPKAVPALYQPVSAGSSNGLGWRLAEHSGARLVFQGGSIQGFCSRATLWPERLSGIVIISAQGGVIQSNLVLPMLVAAAERIMFEGSAPRLFPFGRALLVLAGIALAYLSGLILQAVTAFSWVRVMRDRLEYSPSRALPWITVARTVGGIVMRVALLYLIVPAIAGRMAGMRLGLVDLFYADPGIASAFMATMMFGVARNTARLVWLFSSDLTVRLFPGRYRRGHAPVPPPSAPAAEGAARPS